MRPRVETRAPGGETLSVRPSPRPRAVSARVIRPVSVLRPGLVAVPRSTLPATICLLFLAIDLLLGGAYLADQLAGHPSRLLTKLVDLNGEHNLPAWYSSMQWLCAAGATGIFAFARFDPRSPRSWRLALLPLLFIALSADESIALHEAIGRSSDVLLPGGDRAGTAFARTGLWGLLLGPPLLLLFWGLLRSVRDELERAPEAASKMLLGMIIMLTGAVGLETLSNFIAPDSVLDVLEVFLEEVLEMIGATIILWGGCELLAAYRLTFSLDRK